MGDLVGAAVAIGAIAGEEGLEHLLVVIRQILAPDDRVGRDQRRFPDHLDLLQLLRLGLLQAIEILGVVGGNISSEERRVGKGWVSTCSSRWAPYHKKKKKMTNDVRLVRQK